MIWDMPQRGDYKECLRFAFFPIIIRDKYVWLEFYKIEKQWDAYKKQWVKSGNKKILREEEEL